MALLLAVPTALLTSSCKKEAAERSPSNPLPPPPPGATNDGPVIVEVPYQDLGYKKGIFTMDDEPFTGRAIQKHPDGKLKARYDFVDGLFDGMTEEWYENGQRSGLKHYKAGKRHGITTYWDEDGKPIKQILYQDDEEIEEKVGDDIPKNLGL